MKNYFQFDLNMLGLRTEHFHPHYLDETGIENIQLMGFINEVIAEIPDYCDIRGGYVWVANEITFERQHSFRVQNKIFRAGKVVYNMLKKSEQLCFFLCTAGKGISEWSRSLFIEGDFLKGYLVDMAGSLIVELAVDKLNESIESEARQKGLSITNRYSPGYCDWNVAEQEHLFSFFPENFCGVSLNSSSLMIPEKSISGVIGAGRNIKKIPYTCSLCDMENCLYSNAKKLK
jgi:hypothetical protein